MNVAFQFSGGKDSLAVLYLKRDLLPGATVYFGDTGHSYPHMIDFAQRTVERLGGTLKIVRPPVAIDAFQAERGLPADIVPVDASFEMQPFITKDKRAQLLQSSLSCCAAMLWLPLYFELVQDKITDCYRGNKGADHHVGAGDGVTDQFGITYHCPLWSWTDEQVFTYLKEQGAELPAHYSTVNASFDCMYCTAFLNHPGARGKLEWTRAKYPAAWPKLSGRLQTVARVLDFERTQVDEALGAAAGSEADRAA